MIAKLTRLMILFQLLTLAFIATLLMQFRLLNDWPLSLLAAAFMLMLLRASVIFNNFFLSQALRQPRTDGTRTTLYANAKMMVQEFWFSMVCWFRLFPFSRPLYHLADGDTGLPVILLHGYGANSSFWHRLSRRLKAEGISHCAIDLEPVLASIDDYAERIETAIARIKLDRKSSQIILIAHSMGGLAARAWLRKYGKDSLACAITLGTPHFGSLLAGYGIGVNARQMLPVSAWRLEEKHWLSELAASEDASKRALFVSIRSLQDNIVSPQSSGELPGAKNIAVEMIGHVALGFDERVIDRVMAETAAVRLSA